MQRFKNILVFVGQDDSDSALGRALAIARENHARVTLMDVTKPLPAAIGMMTDTASPEELEQLIREDHCRKLRERALRFDGEALDIQVKVHRGDPVQQIVRRVIGSGHDLVVASANGVSTSNRLFGSTARSLLRNCPCPVWLLKPEMHGEFDQVLAAVDVDCEDETRSELNLQILELAFSVAQRDNAQLHVVTVWDLWMENALRSRAGNEEVDAVLKRRESAVRRKLDDILQSPMADSDAIQIHVRRGNPSAQIFAVAEEVEADLMVMGTVCRTGVAGFLVGNTAENLLSQLTCSVLAVKPAGFVSPIRPQPDDEPVSSSDCVQAK